MAVLSREANFLILQMRPQRIVELHRDQLHCLTCLLFNVYRYNHRRYHSLTSIQGYSWRRRNTGKPYLTVVGQQPGRPRSNSPALSSPLLTLPLPPFLHGSKPSFPERNLLLLSLLIYSLFFFLLSHAYSLSLILLHSVLATLVKNKIVPDPFYGLQNETIIDIADSGRDFYTFWFFTTFHCNLVRFLLPYIVIHLFISHSFVFTFNFLCLPYIQSILLFLTYEARTSRTVTQTRHTFPQRRRCYIVSHIPNISQGFKIQSAKTVLEDADTDTVTHR